MDEKPEIVIFSQNKLGGVQNYFYNLILFDKQNTFEKRWIFSDHVNDNDTKLPQAYNICNELIFSYGNDHIYKSAKKLSDLISNKIGLVLTNHHIELIALHKHRLRKKTIVFFCHDELYINTALDYEFLIDIFIAHNIQFYHELVSVLPSNRKNDVYYLPYGIEVKTVPQEEKRNDRVLKLIFIARLNEKKGVYDLLELHKELCNKNINFTLTIVGDGPEKDKLTSLTKNIRNIFLLQPKTTKEVLEIAADHDIYLLPSYLDGVPVALLEAMSVGLVPIIYKFNEGINEVVNKNNGYIVPSGDITMMTQIIEKLDADRELLALMSKNAKQKIFNDYNAEKRFKDYYQLFEKFLELKKPLRRKLIKYDGRLDLPFIPQFARDYFRKLKNAIR